jgi:hypothetical protein
MIYHDEPTKFDLRTSYSIDESVAKMLGWMHGRDRVETAVQDKYGPIPRHLPHLYSLQHSLETHLQMLLDRAKHEYNEALHENVIAKLYAENESAVDASLVLIAADVIDNEKYDQISHWNKVTEKALNYKRMIQEELDKNDSPELEKDQLTTNESGIVHIKLNSLNEWAKQFGVDIIDAPEGLVEVSSIQKSDPKKRRHDSLSAELEQILNVMQKPTPSKVMAELRSRAGSQQSCITTNLGDGIQWERNNGKVETLSLDALEKRISTWRTHR